MPTTSSSALPYPAASDSPNGPLQIQNLATALDRKVAPAFASIAARNTAIPSPTQGQQCTVTGTEHTYDGAAWRYVRTGFTNGTTDASGFLVVPHGLAAVPTGIILTPGSQASDLLNRVLSLNFTTTDSSNFVVYAHRTDNSAALASNQIQFAWLAFI